MLAPSNQNTLHKQLGKCSQKSPGAACRISLEEICFLVERLRGQESIEVKSNGGTSGIAVRFVRSSTEADILCSTFKIAQIYQTSLKGTLYQLGDKYHSVTIFHDFPPLTSPRISSQRCVAKAKPATPETVARRKPVFPARPRQRRKAKPTPP